MGKCYLEWGGNRWLPLISHCPIGATCPMNQPDGAYIGEIIEVDCVGA